MSASITVSRTESGSADAVRAVSVISTGTVRIHPEHPFGTQKPLYWWLLTSRRWTPPRPVNVYVIEHAKGLILFDTGQDRASVTDDAYFPGGSRYLYHRLARFDIGERDTLTAQLATLGYAPADVDTAIVSHLHQDHIGGLRELTGADLLVSATEWAELAKPAPEPRGFLRSHIQMPGLKWHQISLEPSSDPALAPFTESLDVMGDGSLVLLAHPWSHRWLDVAADPPRRPGRRCCWSATSPTERTSCTRPAPRRGQPAPARRDHRARSSRSTEQHAGPGRPARPRSNSRPRLLGQLTQETPMQTFENTVTIHRSAEEVLAFLADFENIPTWNYAIEDTSKASAGPVGVGTRYRQTRTIPGRSTRNSRSPSSSPASRLAIHGQIGPFQATIATS